MNRSEFQDVEQLFSKCLPITEDVDLFRLYVSYVRRTNDVITGGENARGIVIQAFEFAVNKVGIDINSGSLWNDYLNFLKNWTPVASWEQQQKVDLIRRVYKRLLTIPTEKIEQEWSTYTKWENEINSSTASKFIAEKSADFMDARSWHTEFENVVKKKQLERRVLPITFQSENREFLSKQLRLWNNWISLEKRNRLNLKDEDLLRRRIEYVYKQAISCLIFVPEVWYRFSAFWVDVSEESNLGKCIELLNEGLTLNPRSFLLSFQLSELYQKDNNVEKSLEAYNNLISILTKDHSNVVKGIHAIMNLVHRNDKDDIEADNDEKKSGDEKQEETDDMIKPLYQLSEEKATALVELQEKEEQLRKAITFTYTRLMICCKSSQGITQARSVFKQARNNFLQIGHEIYVEHALMEYYSSNVKSARKIFEFGMSKFNSDCDFLLEYLDFLIMTNRGESIVVVFEQGLNASQQEITKELESIQNQSELANDSILSNFRLKKIGKKQESLKEFFKRFARYQSVYGDLSSITTLEKRYKDMFPDDDIMEFFTNRYRSKYIDVIKVFDLGENEENENKREITKTHIEDNDISVANNTKPENEGALKNTQQPQNFVGNTVYNLLRVLPNSSYFGPQSERVFNSEKLVDLFSKLQDIPTD